MIQKYTNSNGDRAVGDIECRPMQVADKKIKKIDHPSKSNSVDEVPDRTAQNQGKCRSQPGVFLRRFVIKIKNQANGQRRYKKKNDAPQGWAQIRHEPEGATRIVNMGDAKKTFDNGHGMMKWQKPQDEPFGELIQQNNNAGDNHQLYIFVLQHFLILWCQCSGVRCQHQIYLSFSQSILTPACPP